MTEGKFATELVEIEKLLKSVSILEERNKYPSKDFDPATYRKLDYIQNWKLQIASTIYDFLLADNSIFSFKVNFRDDKLSFSFFECPYICQSYAEFLDEHNLSEELEDRAFYDYYEVYLEQCQIKDNPTMIRYDLDADSYFEGLHPVSHMHIGFRNEVRIGINARLTPLTFVHFVLRQSYPVIWKTLLQDANWHKVYANSKQSLTIVPVKNWKIFDKAELHLI